MNTEQTSEIQSVVVHPGSPHPKENRPLISFCLAAYNQEQFIREAVEGAFSQTYSPLEIILSDDCSSDRTFEIMQEMAAAYSGPHEIITNKNEKNLGIGGHINRVVQISSGEFIIGAAGDDISLPERTSEIYKAWIDSGKEAFSVNSVFETINEYGNIVAAPTIRDLPKEQQLLHFSKTLIHYVHGCTHAWHRKVFDVFGPLPNITCEDVAIPPRSMLLGRVVLIDKVLVKYRVHGSNVYESTKYRTDKESLERAVYYLKDRIKICADAVRCINEYTVVVKDPVRVRELNDCVANIIGKSGKLALKVKILTGYPIVRLYFLLKFIFLYGLHSEDVMIVAFGISKTVYSLSRKSYAGLLKFKFKCRQQKNDVEHPVW